VDDVVDVFQLEAQNMKPNIMVILCPNTWKKAKSFVFQWKAANEIRAIKKGFSATARQRIELGAIIANTLHSGCPVHHMNQVSPLLLARDHASPPRHWCLHGELALRLLLRPLEHPNTPTRPRGRSTRRLSTRCSPSFVGGRAAAVTAALQHRSCSPKPLPSLLQPHLGLRWAPGPLSTIPRPSPGKASPESRPERRRPAPRTQLQGSFSFQGTVRELGTFL
jgi:hypothetical protein